MEKIQASVGTTADIGSGVEISKVHGGYFSNLQNAEAFCEIGIAPILSKLPKKVKLFDFGGGEGFLTKVVQDFLTSHGHIVDSCVLDANAKYLKKAKELGFKTVLTSIQDSQVRDADLILARALIHYNSPEKQQPIFEKIYSSLKEGGFFVHQNSSGSVENCKLRSDIVNLPFLGRSASGKNYHWLSEEACIALMERAGFSTTSVVGYAPKNSWSPLEQWNRFNKKKAEEAQDSATLEQIERKKNLFLTKAEELIKNYLMKYNNKDADIEKKGTTSLIWYQYPILLSEK